MIAFINSFIEGVGPWILYVSSALWGIWLIQIYEDTRYERDRAERSRPAGECWDKDLERYYVSRTNSG